MENMMSNPTGHGQLSWSYSDCRTKRTFLREEKNLRAIRSTSMRISLRQKRTELWPKLREARDKGVVEYLCYDKLIVQPSRDHASRPSKWTSSALPPLAESDFVSDSVAMDITNPEPDSKPVSDIATVSHADPDFSVFDQKLNASKYYTPLKNNCVEEKKYRRLQILFTISSELRSMAKIPNWLLCFSTFIFFCSGS